MSHIGNGWMIERRLADDPNSKPEDFIGQKILSAEIDEKALTLALESGKRIVIRDRRQRCCERRYVTTDDDVASLVGQHLRYVDAKEAPDLYNEEDAVHEIAFVEIGGETGFITLVTHNEHNGFYGNFNLVIEDC